jgi:hypothetical protein
MSLTHLVTITDSLEVSKIKSFATEVNQPLPNQKKKYE